MTTDQNRESARVAFRQPAPDGKVLLRIAPLMLLLLVAAGLPIMLTFDTESETAGLFIACAGALLVGALIAWTVRALQTPMLLEAGPDGVAVTNQTTGQRRELDWANVSYTFIEGTSGCLLMIHGGERTLHIFQHPRLSRSPEGFVQLCEVMENHANRVD